MPAEVVRPLLAAVHAMGVVLDWLLTYAVHSTLLIGVVWVLASGRLGRRLHLPGASWPWMTALAGGVLSATLQVSGAVPALGGTVDLGRRLATRATVRLHIVARETVTPARRIAPRRVATQVLIAPRWPIALVLVWAGGAAGSLGWLLLARRRFLRSIAARQSAEFTTAGHALRWVCNRAGVRRPIRLTVADGLTSPVAIGDDEICLPRRVLSEMDHLLQESMLAHELAHLERRDSWSLMVARVIEAVFFFQPLNRLARRRMQDAAELASDAWAVRVVNRPLVLARCLARVAEWTAHAPRLLAPAMAERNTSMLVQRVARLTSGRVPSASRAGPWPALVLAGLVLAIATLLPRPSLGAPPPLRAWRSPAQDRDVRIVVRRPLEGTGPLPGAPAVTRVFFLRATP